jgi:hypothetical protein
MPGKKGERMSTCYANPDPQFQPAMRLISAITNANPASVTTTFAHDYITGTIVRFYIPKAEGMTQLDKMKGTITVTGNTTFTVDIDTTSFDVFAIPGAPAWYQNTCATVVPVGQVSTQLTASVRDVT